MVNDTIHERDMRDHDHDIKMIHMSLDELKAIRESIQLLELGKANNSKVLSLEEILYSGTPSNM